MTDLRHQRGRAECGGSGVTAAGYPLTLHLAGLRVVVVGGGAVAARHLEALLDAGAHVVVIAPAPGAEISQRAAHGAVVLHHRPYQAGDLDGAWLVLACADEPAVNAAVAADAEQARLWCVPADDHRTSSAWTQADGHVDAVTVAVHTGGHPHRAARASDAVVAGLRAAEPPPRRGRPGPGRVALVGGGPGAADLITLRGHRLLRGADIVVTDRLGPRDLLLELPAGVEVVDVSKTPRGPATAQEDINTLLVEHARAGRHVVRLKGGDPFVFGRGGEELLACAKAAVECEVVPGVSSALAVPALAGIPLTHRGLAQEFVVASGHLPPGHPRSTVDWARLGASESTLVLLMAVDTLPMITRELLRAGRPPDTPAACIQDGTTPRQRVLLGELHGIAADAARAGIAPPAVVVVGPVVSLRGPLRDHAAAPALTQLARCAPTAS